MVFSSVTFWNQPEVSTASGSNVMTQRVVFMFWWPWPWPLTYVIFCIARIGISMRSSIRICPAWIGDTPRLKFWKGHMLYNGISGCHGNTCYVNFIGTVICMIHSIGLNNVCADCEINRYKIDEVRTYAKIVFYLTSRDAETVRRTSWGLRHFRNSTSYVMGTTTLQKQYVVRHGHYDTSDRYFNQEHYQ